MITFIPIEGLSGSIRSNDRFLARDHTLQGSIQSRDVFFGAIRFNGIVDVSGSIQSRDRFSADADSVQQAGGGAVISLQKLRSIGADHAYAESQGAFPPLSGEGETTLAAGTYAIATPSMALMSSAGIGLTGEIGGATLALRPLGSISANRPYGASVTALEPLGAFAIEDLLVVDFILSRGVARAAYHIRAPTSVVTIASAATAVRQVHAIAASSGTLASVGSARARYHVIAPSSGIVDSLATYFWTSPSGGVVFPKSGDAADAWVFTLGAELPPISRYADFDFNSFAEIGGRYYAAGSNGIHELGGEDDDALAIEGYVTTGRSQQAADRRTRTPIVYLCGRSEGVLHCRVIDEEGAEFDYTAERALGNIPSRERVKIARGHKMTYWRYRIGNELGQDFELENAGTLVDVQQRRVR